MIAAVLVFLNALLAAAPHPPRETQPLPTELRSYVKAALAEWEIPGVAIAVVKDGRTVALEGFGIRELGRQEPVDVDTLFDTASLSKSFTAAAIATLVDEKRLSWDDPVQKLLPGMAFPDPYLTANVTLRDLLCHRTGVAATNGPWYFGGLKRSQIPGMVKEMKMDAPFRARLVYSNVGYTVAGEAAAAVAKESWEDMVASRLLVPLGMTRTTVEFDKAPAMGNVASGHALIGDSLRPTPRETTRKSVAPCGSIQSSAADMAKWLLFQLGDGSFEGKCILSEASMNEMHSPQVLFPSTPAMRAARQVRFFAGYGMGWQVMDYQGHPLLWHTGAGDGQRVYMALLPSDRLGVLVMLNSSKVEMLHIALGSRIIDHYLGLPARDYVAELKAPWKAGRDALEAEARRREDARKKDTRPTEPAAAYAQTYRDQFGVDVVITESSGKLSLRYGGGERAILEHWEDDTFRVRWENSLHAQTYFTLVQFEVGEQHRVTGLQMSLGRDLIVARAVR
jgi:CubicO group peptidase (beta-lactamase class C family)